MSIDNKSLPYSKIVRQDNTVYVSGVVGRDEVTGNISVNIAEQTEAILTKLEKILNSAGTTLDKGLKVTVYLTDMRSFAEVNSVYRKFFSSDRFPARSCVAVAGLPDSEAKVEIDIIAEVSG